MKTEICDFQFTLRGYGKYEVVYTSPTTGKRWMTITSDTRLIDLTKNSDNPKRKDLNRLKLICKKY